MISKGVKVQTRKELGNADADFVVSGDGFVRWDTTAVSVDAQGIRINGALVESTPSGYRNVVLEKDGSIKVDRFLPFE